jgi:uncharacterized protein (TIGR00730 family)
MGTEIRSLCVFCGASPGIREAYVKAAQDFGTFLAEQKIRVVYGGGNVGLMGALADSALAAGGEVIGVIPQSLMQHEVGHRGVSELRVVRSMHERKAMMADLSDAFVALPGGIGTFEELFEIWTWAQLGLHRKPLGLLDVAGYYDHLIAMTDHAVAEGFLKPKHHAAMMVDTDGARLLDRMRAFAPFEETKWIGRQET